MSAVEFASLRFSDHIAGDACVAESNLGQAYPAFSVRLLRLQVFLFLGSAGVLGKFLTGKRKRALLRLWFMRILVLLRFFRTRH